MVVYWRFVGGGLFIGGFLGMVCLLVVVCRGCFGLFVVGLLVVLLVVFVVHTPHHTTGRQCSGAH